MMLYGRAGNLPDNLPVPPDRGHTRGRVLLHHNYQDEPEESGDSTEEPRTLRRDEKNSATIGYQ